jgi:beta-glucosidase/6-phospho-beta-glucosidase/beta-galactosidase
VFKSFFMAGFECSSHRRPDGLRLDLIEATGHDRLALHDYRACTALGIRTARDGLRWHRIETAAGTYDWSSWTPMLEAAAEAGVQVIWDLFHYGSPDHLDLGSEDFIPAYAAFAAAAVREHRRVTGAPAWVVPVNELSFFAWAVRTGYFPAAGPDENGWLKRHLVRAAIVGARAMREADPDCRFFTAEPLIHVATPASDSDAARASAEGARLSQYEATDLLTGRIEPELGGAPDLVDAIGLNFYAENQWYQGGSAIPLGHRDYRPLSDMLVEAHARYGKPLFLAETMAQGSARPAWLHYVCQEVREAMRQGVPVLGICLYPVTAYPGWDDQRLVHLGLFTAPADGRRQVYEPLAEELKRQQALFASL